ncbi:MAG: glutamate-5-semialdehyde dehydrogenase [Pseudomonadota bacterium]
MMLYMGRLARGAAAELAVASTAQKNAALAAMADAIDAGTDKILEANAKDLAAAEKNGRDAAFLDRMRLDHARVAAMAKGIRDVAALQDPVGETIASWERPNGLEISRVRVPLGVIGMIYESRPNVTADASALCLKSGNAVILRSGSDSFLTALVIANHLTQAIQSAGLPAEAVQIVPSVDRQAVGFMLAGLDGAIDVIVPRGGKSLVARVQDEARVPVFAHLDGNCHVYVDETAPVDMARDVTVNAKMRRTGVCGAAETLLVSRAAVETHLGPIVDGLIEAGCEVRGDPDAQHTDSRIKTATDEDWDTEYLAPIIAVRVVDGLNDAIDHINEHGSHHTDAIVTSDDDAAAQFLSRVDSAIVLRNASTQFADGGEFGMGAEIGIATGRFHARGPVGVEQLTTFKYVVRGQGQTRP